MSYPVGTNPDTSKILNTINTDPLTGILNGKSVVKPEQHTAKAWYTVAIVIGGIIAIGVTGTGIMGLLQSHGLISLPQGLGSVIGTIGSTPGACGLWMMTFGGPLIGGVMIAIAAHKIHQIRKSASGTQIDPISEEVIPDKPKGKPEPIPELLVGVILKEEVTPEDILAQQAIDDVVEEHKAESQAQQKYLEKQNRKLQEQRQREAKWAQQQIEPGQLSRLANALKKLKTPSKKFFGNHFATLGIDAKNFNIGPTTYHPVQFTQQEGFFTTSYVPESRPDRFCIIIKTGNEELLCTQRITKEAFDQLIQSLEDGFYTKYKKS